MFIRSYSLSFSLSLLATWGKTWQHVEKKCTFCLFSLFFFLFHFVIGVLRYVSEPSLKIKHSLTHTYTRQNNPIPNLRYVTGLV